MRNYALRFRKQSSCYNDATKEKIRLCYYRKYVQMLVMNFKNVELSTFEERFEIFHPAFVKKRQVS